jgi:hypothetical protein
MMAKEWKDFVVNPHGLIIGKKERFNLQHPEGKIVTKDLFQRGTEIIEAVEIGEVGSITIWTTTKVWCIRNERGYEKLIYLPRNPPAENA